MPDLEPMGTEAEDLPSYYLSVAQKMTDGVGADFAYGDVVVRPGPIKLELDDGPGFEGVVAFRKKARHRSVEGVSDCTGLEVNKGVWAGDKYGECAKCHHWQAKDKNYCGTQYVYFIRVTKGWPDQDSEPPICVLKMERSSLSAARSLNAGFVVDGDFPFRSVFRFGSADGKSKEYQFKVWTVKRVGPTPKEILKNFETDYVQLQSGGALLMLSSGGGGNGKTEDPAPGAGPGSAGGDSFEFGDNVK